MLSSWEACFTHRLPATCSGPSALQHQGPCLPLHCGGPRLSSSESSPVPRHLGWQRPKEAEPVLSVVGELGSTGGPGVPPAVSSKGLTLRDSACSSRPCSDGASRRSYL